MARLSLIRVLTGKPADLVTERLCRRILPRSKACGGRFQICSKVSPKLDHVDTYSKALVLLIIGFIIGFGVLLSELYSGSVFHMSSTYLNR